MPSHFVLDYLHQNSRAAKEITLKHILDAVESGVTTRDTQVIEQTEESLLAQECFSEISALMETHLANTTVHELLKKK